MSGQGVYPGCVDPVSTVFVAECDDTAIDLTDVTAARIKVRFANGTDATWEAELSGADVGEVTLTRAHDAEDVPPRTEGTAYIYAELDLVGGATLITEAQPLPVLKVGV
jgi:hypothetical protein